MPALLLVVQLSNNFICHQVIEVIRAKSCNDAAATEGDGDQEHHFGGTSYPTRGCGRRRFSADQPWHPLNGRIS